MKRLVLSVALLSIVSCQDSRPPDPAFVNLFVDIRLVTQELGANDAKARMQRSALLRQYGYTPESFQAESDRMVENPDNWRLFQDAVVARLDSLVKWASAPLGKRDSTNNQKSSAAPAKVSKPAEDGAEESNGKRRRPKFGKKAAE